MERLERLPKFKPLIVCVHKVMFFTLEKNMQILSSAIFSKKFLFFPYFVVVVVVYSNDKRERKPILGNYFSIMERLSNANNDYFIFSFTLSLDSDSHLNSNNNNNECSTIIIIKKTTKPKREKSLEITQ